MKIPDFFKYLFAYIRKLWGVLIVGIVFFSLDLLGFIQLFFPNLIITKEYYLYLFLISFFIANLVIFINESRVIESYSESGDEIAADRRTFQRLMELLPSNGAIKYLYEVDYNSFIRLEHKDKIWDFIYECELPDFEFYNEKLESEKINLKNTLLELCELLAGNTFKENPNYRIASIPRDWFDKNPQNVKELVDKMTSLSIQAWNIYGNLVREARKL